MQSHYKIEYTKSAATDGWLETIKYVTLSNSESLIMLSKAEPYHDVMHLCFTVLGISSNKLAVFDFV